LTASSVAERGIEKISDEQGYKQTAVRLVEEIELNKQGGLGFAIVAAGNGEY
jgi:hypothetical protein